MKTNEIALIGFFKRERDLQHNIFLEVVWKLHQEVNRDDIGAGIGAVTLQGVSKQATNETLPCVVAYLDGKVVEDDGTFREKKWTRPKVEDFLKQFLPLSTQNNDVNDHDEF